MDLKGQLIDFFKKQDTTPFLFVGSGLSRRYIDLEDWSGLLKRFCEYLPNEYDFYYASAKAELPRVASLMADDFFEVWWKDSRFEQSRAVFKGFSDKSDCLKYEIAKYIQSKKYEPGKNEELDREVDLLGRVVMDGIITTNWDLFLEQIFFGYVPYIGQEQVVFTATHGVGEIYKIHGCSTDSSSLILTGEDYHGYNDRNAYLAARLLTTFVDHPIVFLGYSLSDDNIISILSKIVDCLSVKNLQRLSKRLIFVQRDKYGNGDSIIDSVSQIGGQTIPITVVTTNDFSCVYEALSQIKRKFSARLLRSLKNQVYELVLHGDPKQKVLALDIDKADDYKDLEVVFGVGVISRIIASKGYSSLKVEDLLNDIVHCDGQLDSSKIIYETFPALCKGNVKYVPIFKYLKAVGYIGDESNVKFKDLPNKVKEVAQHDASYFEPKAKARLKHKDAVSLMGSIAEVVARYGNENALFYIPLLKFENIDLDGLRGYIVANIDFMHSEKPLMKTYFGSLICLYDYIKYGTV